MTAFALLVVAGFGAGVVGTVAGLASLVSYPALLAAGLPPLSANVSMTRHSATLPQAHSSTMRCSSERNAVRLAIRFSTSTRCVLAIWSAVAQDCSGSS